MIDICTYENRCSQRNKNNEFRVAITPYGVKELISHGHEVFVEKNAGANSSFLDKDYKNEGAIILDDNKSIFDISDLILKVKEPIEEEYSLIKENQIVFTYFHFASHKPLLDAMIKSNSVCIAYETVEDNNGSLPLLVPMSEVAGRMATQEGAKYLEKPMGGRGILLGGVSGVEPANVLIIGGGISGTEAAKMAVGLQANVTILDTSEKRLNELNELFDNKITCLDAVGKYFSTKFILWSESSLPSGVSIIVGAELFEALASPHKIATASNCLSPAESLSVSTSTFFFSKIFKLNVWVSILIDLTKSFFLCKLLKESKINLSNLLI